MAPAVTVVEACPVESVVTDEEPSVATPEVTWKFTVRARDAVAARIDNLDNQWQRERQC